MRQYQFMHLSSGKLLFKTGNLLWWWWDEVEKRMRIRCTLTKWNGVKSRSRLENVWFLLISIGDEWLVWRI
jgi:hypothetical protein